MICSMARFPFVTGKCQSVLLMNCLIVVEVCIIIIIVIFYCTTLKSLNY